MIENYLKIAIKVLLRRKFYTAVSLFGIAFTLMVLLVAASMADHLLAPLPPEVNLSRTLQISWLRGEKEDEGRIRMYQGGPGYALLDRYARNIPGVEQMSIFSDVLTATSFVKGEKVESRLRYTDGPYWEIHDFRFIEGGPFTSRDDEDGNLVAVINEGTRKRLFGGVQAMNRTLTADGRSYRVIGVVENVARTRFNAESDIWLPLSAAPSQGFRTEILGGFQASLLAESRGDFERIKTEFVSRLPYVDTNDRFDTLKSIPMTRLEASSLFFGRSDDGHPHMYRALLIGAAMIALFLFLPTINLISINLSRIFERSPEIGIRKSFGASSAHLVAQFIVENVFLCFVGSILALGGAAIVLHWIERNGWIPYAEFTINFRVFLCALGLALFLGLLTGAFPAWRMSRLHPVRALRGGIR